MKKIIFVLLLVLMLSGCNQAKDDNQTEVQIANKPPVGVMINPEGTILKERFKVPEGFSRVESEPGSFGEFLQQLPLKPDNTKVKNFDGSEKAHDVHLAVVDYSLGDRDLQQCADAVMRLRAEYFYEKDALDMIHFNFTNGFKAEFSTWASGHSIAVNDNDVSWVKDSKRDGTRESFDKFMNMVYAYAGTLSLKEELISKDIQDLQIGDVFIHGGSPGHAVIVVDMAINDATGQKIFMLAQSYMPAQDIQILKGDTDNTPWYDANIEQTLDTPEWTFEKTELRAW